MPVSMLTLESFTEIINSASATNPRQSGCHVWLMCGTPFSSFWLALELVLNGFTDLEEYKQPLGNS